MQKLLSTLSLIFILTVLGCREEEILPQEPSSPVSISGYVQKGPFINGTSIIITELDDSLAATGKTFTTQITDNKGTFFIKTSQLDHTNLQMMASGFYFDEVKGEKSAAQLTLFALADVSEDANINVNVLSHLEKDRVNYLINRGKSFVEAKRQAQQEILAIFRIERAEMTNSELLDISQVGYDNAILLAISAILQGNQTVAELSELLADITTDLREDGTLDSETVKAKLVQNAINLDLPQVRQNLQARYQELEVEASIPNFEQFVDSDGDGILNKDEDDTPEDFVFETQENVAINANVVSNEVMISGISENGFITASVQNGKFIKNGERITEDRINIVNGDKIKIEITSSTNYSDTTIASITLGSLKKTFIISTDDYLPEEFTFDPIQSAIQNTSYTSNTILVSGLKYPTPTKISNGALIKNGTKLTVDSTTVVNGDQLAIEITSYPEWQNKVQASLKVGNKEEFFEVVNKNNLWTRRAKFPGEGYSRQVSFTLNGKIYVGLGWEKTQGTTKEFYKYDPTQNTWQKAASFKGISRRDAVAFTHDGKAYIGLGIHENLDNGTNKTLKDFWEYDPESNSWTQIEDFPGSSRASATYFKLGNEAYVGLGYRWQGYENCLKDFWKFNGSSKTWVRIADFAGNRRRDATSFSFESEGYVIGGADQNYQNKADVWKYNPTNDKWSKLNNSLLENTTYGTAFTVNGRAYIGSGVPNQIDKEYFYEYNPETEKWILLDGLEIRSGSTVSILGGKVYYFNYSESWEYTP